MLSSYQGRVGPGDVLFNYKFPPGFTKSRTAANNATLGVNTLSRVVGLDGLNRLLMGSGPNGWRVGENVYEVRTTSDGAYGVLAGDDGVFALTTLNEYRLDGVVHLERRAGRVHVERHRATMPSSTSPSRAPWRPTTAS